MNSDEFREKYLSDRPEYAILLSGYMTREDLTVEELSRLSGISENDLNMMKNGKMKISESQAHTLAIILNTEHSRFLEK